MAKDVSAIVSGMGVALALVEGICKRVKKIGGTDEDIHRLVTGDGEATLDEIAKLILGGKLSVARSTYSVTVDYGTADRPRTLADMVKDGNYDWVNDDITEEHFPLELEEKGNGKVEKVITLLHFNRVMTSEQVIVEMDKDGYRLATIDELLALGATFPDLQREFPMIALGSRWRARYGNHDVPYLDRFGSRRHLYLRWFGDGWHEDCRFLAVRKS